MPRTALFLVVLCVAGVHSTMSQPDVWQRTNGPDHAIFALATDSTSGDIYAATSGGLFRTNDMGATWTIQIEDKIQIHNSKCGVGDAQGV